MQSNHNSLWPDTFHAVVLCADDGTQLCCVGPLHTQKSEALRWVMQNKKRYLKDFPGYKLEVEDV